MSEYEIRPYHKTGEFCGVSHFSRKVVDWNKMYSLTKIGCHCIWVESDLESYIKVYGMEKDCVHTVLENLEDYLGELNE